MGIDTIICNGGGGLIMIAHKEHKNFLSVMKSVIKCNFEEKNSHQFCIKNLKALY